MTDLDTGADFVSGTSIVAADMNAKFAAIEALVNTTGVPKAQAGVIDATALATAAVTAAKLAAQGVGSVTSPSTATGAATNVVLSGSGSSAIETDATTVDVDATTSRLTAKRTGVYALIQTLRANSVGSSSTVYGGWAVNGTGQTWNSAPYPMSLTSSMNIFEDSHVRILSLTANDYVQGFARSAPNSSTVEIRTALVYLGPAS